MVRNFSSFLYGSYAPGYGYAAATYAPGYGYGDTYAPTYGYGYGGTYAAQPYGYYGYGASPYVGRWVRPY